MAKSKEKSWRVGAWSVIPDPIAVEALARSGADWVGLDLQHGGFDLGWAFRAIQLLDVMNVPAYVRVSQDQLDLIPRVCDHGASGVIVAMVEGPEVAARALAEARYHPAGRRSFGGQRFGMRSTKEAASAVEPKVFAMIESVSGLSAVESIAAVHGLAGLHVGPVDLGLALGLGMDRDQPPWRQAIDRIKNAAHDAGLPATMHAVRADDAHRWLDAGFDELILEADIAMLRDAIASTLANVRQMGLSPG